LGRIDEIFQARPGTPEGHELELLVLQVEEYEDRVYPIDPPEFESVREFAQNRCNP
jgi:HTH-type transcriptional regulator/antitoxin HigA